MKMLALVYLSSVIHMQFTVQSGECSGERCHFEVDAFRCVSAVGCENSER